MTGLVMAGQGYKDAATARSLATMDVRTLRRRYAVQARKAAWWQVWR